MKHIWKIGVATAILGTCFAGGVLASPSIKILINNKFVASDASPVISNNRVLVPISLITKELHIPTTWDQKTKTVSINPDIYSGGYQVTKSTWVGVRNTISKFFIAYDERDHEAGRSLLTSNFSSNKFNIDELMPAAGGDMPNILDYRFGDMNAEGTICNVRVYVTWDSYEDLWTETWDVVIDGSTDKIQKITILKEKTERLLSYTNLSRSNVYKISDEASLKRGP